MRRALISLFGLSLLLSACGSEKLTSSQPPTGKATPGAKVSAAGVLLAAQQKTVAAKSAKMSFQMDFLTSATQPAGSMSGVGAFDFPARTGSLDFTLEIEGFPQGVHMEERLLGNILYMQFKGVNIGPKPWLKLDLVALGKKAGIDVASLSQFEQNDPASTLSYLQGVSGDVTEAGTEKIRGVQTTKYTATVDLKRAMDKVPAKIRPSFQHILKLIGTSTLPIEVWIDDAGRTRRLHYSMDMSHVKGADQGASIDITMDLFDFGAPVHVTAPPASQVADGEAVLSGK